jgi:hypothetical protein
VTELELVQQLGTDVPLDDDYARDAQARAARRLRALAESAPPPRQRPRRALLLAGAIAVSVAALLLLTRAGSEQSTVARAAEALELPRTGIFVLDSHSYWTKAPGVVLDSHYAVWQSLDHPAARRSLQTDPERGTLSDRSSLGDLSMRYDRKAGVVYTQRVIVSPHAVLTPDARQDLGDQQRLRSLLGSGHMHDDGTITRDGREYRRLAYSFGNTSCAYLVDAHSFRPARLDCLTRAGGGGDRTHDVVTYRLVPSTSGNARMFDLRAAYPAAGVEHDPAGIPGRAGNDLADVTQPSRYSWLGSDPILQRTDDAALRAFSKLRARAVKNEINCLVRHGVPFAHGGYDDPIGTVTAICEHLQDDAEALEQMPAAVEFMRRNTIAVDAYAACMRKSLHGKREGTAAGNAIARRCASTTRDPIAGGFDAPARP